MAYGETSTGDSFTVKVDGREEQVSLNELQNGYQRQADYTRKTQELASERERLAQGEAIVQALEADPEGAITALAGSFGVGVGNQKSSSPEQVDYEDVDPDEVRLRRIESSIEEQNRALRQQNLQKEVKTLRDKYENVDFDEKALYAHALKNKINNLDAAFTHMNWDKMQTVAKDAEIVEEKRAAQIVDGIPGSSEGNVERAVRAVDSIRDAFSLATQELSDS
tara:strand:- start:1169 stop:1837 length:669 start_codon:yes stop_codon:yes gene_type:complete